MSEASPSALGSPHPRELQAPVFQKALSAGCGSRTQTCLHLHRRQLLGKTLSSLEASGACLRAGLI